MIFIEINLREAKSSHVFHRSRNQKAMNMLFKTKSKGSLEMHSISSKR